MFKWLKKQRKEPYISFQIRNLSEDELYQDWLCGGWLVRNNSPLPPISIAVLESDKTIEEIVDAIRLPDEARMCTGHEASYCAKHGISIRDGLERIFYRLPSTWRIMRISPFPCYDKSGRITSLELFMVQEFAGSEPGHPNRDICTIHIRRELAPLSFQLQIPYATLNGVSYMRINVGIKETGITCELQQSPSRSTNQPDRG